MSLINEINKKLIKALEEKTELLKERIDILNVIIDNQNDQINTLKKINEMRQSVYEKIGKI